MMQINTSVNAGVKRERIALDEDDAEHQPKKKRRKTNALSNPKPQNPATFLPLREDK